MQDDKIIPTQYKAKIPRALSYPVGSEAISEALRSVPQYPSLSVHFSYSNQLARRHGTATPYPVIEVRFSGPHRFLSASLSIEEQLRQCPRWILGVHAVPRPLRDVVQTFSFDELESRLISEEHASVEWKTQKADT